MKVQLRTFMPLPTGAENGEYRRHEAIRAVFAEVALGMGLTLKERTLTKKYEKNHTYTVEADRDLLNDLICTLPDFVVGWASFVPSDAEARAFAEGY